jgi:DNA-binding HxlR family transcriptional regulator
MIIEFDKSFEKSRENELKIKVDHISSRALKEQLRDPILKQVQYL